MRRQVCIAGRQSLPHNIARRRPGNGSRIAHPVRFRQRMSSRSRHQKPQSRMTSTPSSRARAATLHCMCSTGVRRRSSSSGRHFAVQRRHPFIGRETQRRALLFEVQLRERGLSRTGQSNDKNERGRHVCSLSIFAESTHYEGIRLSARTSRRLVHARDAFSRFAAAVRAMLAGFMLPVAWAATIAPSMSSRIASARPAGSFAPASPARRISIFESIACDSTRPGRSDGRAPEIR